MKLLKHWIKWTFIFVLIILGLGGLAGLAIFLLLKTKVPDSVLVIIYPVLILTITYLGIIIYGYLYKKYR